MRPKKSTLMHLHLRSGVNTHSRCDVQVCGSLILICIISKHLETVFINDLMYLLVYLQEGKITFVKRVSNILYSLYEYNQNEFLTSVHWLGLIHPAVVVHMNLKDVHSFSLADFVFIWPGCSSSAETAPPDSKASLSTRVWKLWICVSLKKGSFLFHVRIDFNKQK